MERTLFDADEHERHTPAQHKGLHNPSSELRETGDYEGHVAKSSLYTKARLHPRITAGSFAFLATALGYALFRRVNLNGSSNSEAKGL